MTAAQLEHLAQLATEAADFFTATNPAQARTLGNAAKAAALLAERQQRAEELRDMRRAVQVLKAAIAA